MRSSPKSTSLMTSSTVSLPPDAAVTSAQPLYAGIHEKRYPNHIRPSLVLRWFVGGQTNLAWNCVDRHVQAGNGGRAALACEDEHGDRTVLTYAQLQHEVRRTAAALRGLGIGRGDRLGIYMPTCREAIVLMLACVRIGAVWHAPDQARLGRNRAARSRCGGGVSGG